MGKDPGLGSDSDAIKLLPRCLKSCKPPRACPMSTSRGSSCPAPKGPQPPPQIPAQLGQYNWAMTGNCVTGPSAALLPCLGIWEGAGCNGNNFCLPNWANPVSGIQPWACFAVPLTQKVAQVLGWITAWAGDVQEKGLEPCPAVTGLPALLWVGDHAARLSLPARFALKNI